MDNILSSNTYLPRLSIQRGRSSPSERHSVLWHQRVAVVAANCVYSTVCCDRSNDDFS